MTNLVIGQIAPAVSTRERILDAAESLLGRFGYRRMTVDDIAAEAGIGKGTVYLSFRSKEDVVLSTVDRIVDRVCAEMESEAKEAGTAAEALRKMLLARIFVRFEAVAGYSSSLNDLLGSVRASLLARRARHFEREMSILARVVSAGQKRGEIVAGSPRRIAKSLVLATNSFLPYSLSPAELGHEKRLRKDAGAVIDIVVDGIACTRRQPTEMRRLRS